MIEKYINLEALATKTPWVFDPEYEAEITQSSKDLESHIDRNLFQDSQQDLDELGNNQAEKIQTSIISFCCKTILRINTLMRMHPSDSGLLRAESKLKYDTASYDGKGISKVSSKHVAEIIQAYSDLILFQDHYQENPNKILPLLRRLGTHLNKLQNSIVHEALHHNQKLIFPPKMVEESHNRYREYKSKKDFWVYETGSIEIEVRETTSKFHEKEIERINLLLLNMEIDEDDIYSLDVDILLQLAQSKGMRGVDQFGRRDLVGFDNFSPKMTDRINGELLHNIFPDTTQKFGLEKNCSFQNLLAIIEKNKNASEVIQSLTSEFDEGLSSINKDIKEYNQLKRKSANSMQASGASGLSSIRERIQVGNPAGIIATIQIHIQKIVRIRFLISKMHFLLHQEFDHLKNQFKKDIRESKKKLLESVSTISTDNDDIFSDIPLDSHIAELEKYIKSA